MAATDAAAGPVGREDLERQLAALESRAASREAGLFGPGSMTWRIDRESLLFLGAGRALLLQLAHPWVATAIAEHSRTLDDPIGRFHRTFGTVYTMIFGTTDDALSVARRLHRLHDSIQGSLPEDAGPWPAGSAYRANQVDALAWVHATLVETALMVHNLILPPLNGRERELYFAESKSVAALFGIPPERQPRDWAAFCAYCRDMQSSDVLTVTPVARTVAERIMAGADTWIVTPAWYRALTAMLMPPRLRADFGLSYGPAEQQAALRALRWMRRIYAALPGPLRFVGPYHEAMARLSQTRMPSLVARASNRFWIGRPSLVARGVARRAR